MRFLRIVGSVGLLAALLSACAEDEACPGCELVFSPDLTIRGDEQRAAFLMSTKLRRAADGRYSAAPLANPATVGIFSASGQLQGLIGSRGGGPGEIRLVEGVTTWGD